MVEKTDLTSPTPKEHFVSMNGESHYLSVFFLIEKGVLHNRQMQLQKDQLLLSQHHHMSKMQFGVDSCQQELKLKE